ncbi:hypothetical protein TBLA_0A05580 [Henningerozyma blattae CBS 6284]|uniref:DNA polymerase epsilon catalytic subunit n=1 Tax=Henningerozyma blattae (strain ATCC 34711 / CBS 6284 / DSM 70876 / NBRC 10599 / NRRL Y-10934 / UCD 77-7) TaxID=1071380 RepID=I2GW49_HENB6|nr:hypothetical protein TBLA_0A05580 [Tetrapisispora blattae CBS 6284]CCH58351.1 hypothetical protein TBLA_0A05580 [Tetrapisispora blattae CBS 6284]
MSSRFKGSTAARFVKNSNSNSNATSKSNSNPYQRNNISTSYAQSAQQIIQTAKVNDIDNMMGFERYIPPQFGGKIDSQNLDHVPGRVGWLTNMHPVTLPQEVISGGQTKSSTNNMNSGGIAGVDFYFLDEEGGSFKATINYDPYFFVICNDVTRINEMEEFLKKFLETCLKSIEIITKEDLSLDNHLVGLKRTLLKLNFVNSNNLFEARKLLRPILTENSNTKRQRDIYKKNIHTFNTTTNNNNIEKELPDIKESLDDIKEYDVPYHVRVSIDKNIRVGKWYKVTIGGFFEVDKVVFADPVVLAFDIETTKPPLKFPDSSVDQVMMISYMIDGEGYLITNREIISEDIEDFEYSPKPEYQGNFTIFNEDDELALLQRFFEHIRDVRPTVIATFNGDFFDWPFIDTRAKFHGLDMFDEIGFAVDSEGEYKSSYCSHMDCFRWVKRDSYLPQGSQGLKAVTQAKLGYNPIELDPELMTPYAYEKPQHLSEYSVSDAVATYYLYMKYVHPFVFSLCTIIPLNPDEVLRKGTGTLCEMLLMVQAYQCNILLPNKHTDPIERFYDGHLLESETYVGGHVESLEAGVFRSDIPNDFKIDPNMIDELLDDLPNALKFCVEVENKAKIGDVINFDEIQKQVKDSLLALKNDPKRYELPLIYHVDVASMYPNIMITNRLQPDSMKTERDCASCDFNRPGKRCDRRLKWAWRGEYFPAKMDEYNMIKRALQNEVFPNKNKNSKKEFLTFDELSYSDQVAHIKKRLTDYCKKVYSRTKVSEVVEREAIVCQRENPFYANTVRSFRDRRYDFKGLAKTWKQKLAAIDKEDTHAREEAKKTIVLYDSLQLAHKVILNSFYGYVMRKGSRWYSMEMAGITCLTGATIIQMARSVVEKVGRPLELDTDGIWCILPKSFPENYFFKLENGKKLYMSYPCSMLNYKVHQKFTNHQYQTLVDPIKHKYETHSENSIFFEVDGPYKAIILPTSKEEGKGIKKRYAVFNDDGSLAELKGFELKRRGELQLIKNFQSDIFKVFLDGDTLENCYKAVAAVANRWLDVLDSKGQMLEDEDLISLICENRSMSKTLKEYEGQKSTSITTAKRLGQFLGEDMVKDKGLQCKYIISTKPLNAPVTERAIPVAIFSTDIDTKRTFLRRWTMDPTLDNFDIRTIIDWEYYRERVASVVQKIISIPAALQNVSNPVPRVQHPEWLQKKISQQEDKFKQSSLTKFFSTTKIPPKIGQLKDIEDLFKATDENNGINIKKVAKISTRKMTPKRRRQEELKNEEASLVLPSEMPSIDDDYEAWLGYQKIKWKIQARDRKRRAQLFGASNSGSGRTALGNMVRRQAESYSKSVWEILQYKSSSEPGIVDVYVTINGKIQTLKFKVPKIIYIKVKNNLLPHGKINHCMVEKCTFDLPSNMNVSDSQPGELYKLILPEEVYLDEIHNSTSLLNHENVVGVFEGTIQPTERVTLELGSSVIFNSTQMGSLGKGLQQGFDMKNLSMTDHSKYLSRFSSETCYLLHIVTNIGYEFFILYKSWSNTIKVFTLKPSSHAAELSSGSLQQVFKNYFQKKYENNEKDIKLVKLSEDMIFELDSFTDISQLYRKLNKSITKVKEEKGIQLILFLQSPYIQKLTRFLKPLNQVPIVKVSMSEVTLPPLNWQGTMTKRISQYLVSLGSWYAHLLALSKYSNIPLCNLQLDNMGYVIDVIYARKLKREGIIIWWNENGPLPDLGGKQKDFDINTSWTMNNLQFPRINVPDVYDNVILEIDIKNLVVNTVLGITLFNDAEGSDMANASLNNTEDSVNGQSSTFIQDAFSGPSLLVLRNMLKDWWDDAMKQNSIADLLVNSLIAWVQNPDSKLFDGTLRYHINNLSKKAMLQLMNEFYSLGGSVVYADRNKLFIKTTKFAPENSYAYGQYMMKAIRTNPCFNYLELNIVRYWDLLIWMDKYNFGGLACNTIEDRDKQDFRAYSQWQIKKFLPIALQAEFEDWIMIILDSMLRTKRSFFEKDVNTQRLTQLGPQSKQDIDEDSEGPLASFTDIFAKSLIQRVGKLFRTQQESALYYSEEYKFPELPGSYLDMRNPVLVFVKFLCHIMLLSKKNTLEVRSLRKELLKTFEVREFHKSAEFVNPSTSLELANCLCEHCYFTTDLDMCKEEPGRLFNCERCQKPRNKTQIEEYLIQNLTTGIQSYLSQDSRCVKCHTIRVDYMSPHCKCSGKWGNVTSHESILETIKVFDNVATFFGFTHLQAALEQMI